MDVETLPEWLKNNYKTVLVESMSDDALRGMILLFRKDAVEAAAKMSMDVTDALYTLKGRFFGFCKKQNGEASLLEIHDRWAQAMLCSVEQVKSTTELRQTLHDVKRVGMLVSCP